MVVVVPAEGWGWEWEEGGLEQEAGASAAASAASAAAAVAAAERRQAHWRAADGANAEAAASAGIIEAAIEVPDAAAAADASISPKSPPPLTQEQKQRNTSRLVGMLASALAAEVAAFHRRMQSCSRRMLPGRRVGLVQVETGLKECRQRLVSALETII